MVADGLVSPEEPVVADGLVSPEEPAAADDPVPARPHAAEAAPLVEQESSQGDGSLPWVIYTKASENSHASPTL